MNESVRRWRMPFAAACSLLLIATSTASAVQLRPRASRFDALVVENPTRSIDVATTPIATLPANERLRGAWAGFRAAHGQAWSIYLDRRSGAPLLVEGRGIPWPVGRDATVESIAASLRPMIAGNRALLLADDAELVLDRNASGKLSRDVWQIVFGRAILGVPVTGERFVFTIGHGRLISFGAPRWSRIETSPLPTIDAQDAVRRLTAYMRLSAADRVRLVDKGSLQLIPLRATGGRLRSPAGRYFGPIGAGYESALVWRVALTIDQEPGTWEAYVDAHTGAIRSFGDINEYAQAKGGVYPLSDDQICPEGCEQASYPMPFTNIAIGAGSQTTSSSGFFSCAPSGSTATTTLAGPYVRVVDNCGPISESVSCDDDLDLLSGAGTDCVVPPGASAGNTHAARSGFYHLNRIVEHARSWLPGNFWLTQQITDHVNLNQTCNAYWNGTSVNFFKSGDGCNNTGEIAGIFLHEWGHGLDQNDGGGFDNPSEAYADITSTMSTHVSCMGRGFSQSQNCSGYGDTCLSCTGVRDLDWDAHASHTPATPSGFAANNCFLGSGPCGREVHCEGYIGGETMWDLATRDLPASGLDPASSWQLADKLWFKSRLGSGGDAYNCALPASDGCSATTWFTKLRAIDDDDGNLANGTPHAAAIFAAFDRHDIACGTASDVSNQNSTTCPLIGTPQLSASAGTASALLSWPAVSGAASYNILRSDASCAAGSTIIATIPGLTFSDAGLVNGFTEYYTVQAVGTNDACDGLLSNCQPVTPQPFAGVVKFGAAAYSCQSAVHVTVTDANIGASTTTVTISSTTEPAGETITLTQVAPFSVNYAGTLLTTGNAPAPDGLISVVGSDTITAAYVDADDAQGGVNLTRQAVAGVDCDFPIISNVDADNVTGNSARITWDTDKPSTSVVHYGLTAPPATSTGLSAKIVGHAINLTGLAECSSYLYAVESVDAVGNTAVDDLAGSYYTFATGKNTTPNYESTDTPVEIPDNDPLGATSTITVLDNKIVQGVRVTLNLTHTYDGDLVLTLIPPVGAPITLTNQRGGAGADFAGTVFDDAAATSIATGSAPFTGSFRPESPLSSANGINAAGVWRLKAVDAAPDDVGAIGDWTLTLGYPTEDCGPHAVWQSHALIADSCATGGAGAGDASWDAGEQVNFKVNVRNDGTAALSGVTATITSTTPGVVILDGTASYPDLPPAAAADSLAPHFAAYLPTSLACGGTVEFQVAVTSNEGSWSGPFSQFVGEEIPHGGTVLDETFSGGVPATWTVVDGGLGGGPASTWTTANPGDRSFAPPLAAPVAMVDSDSAGSGSGVTQDEALITPAMNLQSAVTATLEFDQFFLRFAGNEIEVADVDVRSTLTAGAWVNVLRQQNASSANPDHKVQDITAQAAGAPDVQVRFHYYNGHYEWFWQVDNVRVEYSLIPSCNQNVCTAGPGTVKPVADGSFGVAMRGSRVDASGSAIDLTWDVATCSSTDHHLLYGDLAGVWSPTVIGALCDLSSSGSATWTGVPAGDLWFVVVGDNDQTAEGSWGTTSFGERGGTTASGRCGLTTRDNSSTCP